MAVPLNEQFSTFTSTDLSAIAPKQENRASKLMETRILLYDQLLTKRRPTPAKRDRAKKKIERTI